jgi:hypothetical protein
MSSGISLERVETWRFMVSMIKINIKNQRIGRADIKLSNLNVFVVTFKLRFPPAAPHSTVIGRSCRFTHASSATSP